MTAPLDLFWSTTQAPLPPWTSFNSNLARSTIQVHSGTYSAQVTPLGSGSLVGISSEQVRVASRASVVVNATSVGRKVVTSSVTSLVAITSVKNAGSARNANVTALVSIGTSSVGGKRVTSSITTNVVITASSVAGVFERILTGYSMDSGLNQPATWAAIILRMRMGQPVGDDVDSLKSLYRYWRLGAIPSQFAPSLTATQQSLGTAAWAVLAASGGLVLPSIVLSSTVPPLPGTDVNPPYVPPPYVPPIVSGYYPGTSLFPGAATFALNYGYPGASVFPGTTLFPLNGYPGASLFPSSTRYPEG